MKKLLTVAAVALSFSVQAQAFDLEACQADVEEAYQSSSHVAVALMTPENEVMDLVLPRVVNYAKNRYGDKHFECTDSLGAKLIAKIFEDNTPRQVINIEQTI